MNLRRLHHTDDVWRDTAATDQLLADHPIARINQTLDQWDDLLRTGLEDDASDQPEMVTGGQILSHVGTTVWNRIRRIH